MTPTFRSAFESVLAVVYLIFNEGYTREFRRAAGPPRTLRGSHPPWTTAGRADARRNRKSWACSRSCCSSDRAGARGLVSNGDLVLLADQDRSSMGSHPDRRRPGDRAAMSSAQPAWPVSDSGGNQCRPQRRAHRRRHRLAADPAAVRPASRRWRRAPSSLSTARSRSPKSRDRTRHWRSSMSSTSRSTTCSMRSALTCSGDWDATSKRLRHTTRPSREARTPPSAASFRADAMPSA